MGRVLGLKCLGPAGLPLRPRARRSFPEAHGNTSGCSDVEYLTFSELGVQDRNFERLDAAAPQKRSVLQSKHDCKTPGRAGED